MWSLEPTEEFRRRSKRFSKDYPRELTAVLANLDRVQKSLQEGANPLDIPLGCIHKERRGVLAIDQKGGGKNLAQSRLYIYLCSDDEIVYVITLGDKKSQPADVQFSAEFVDSLTASKRRGDSDA